VQNAAIKSSGRIESRHLPEGAGTVLRSLSSSPDALLDEPTPTPLPSDKSFDPADYARIEQALRSHQGNVAGTARALGLHRTQLRRLIERYGLDPQRYAPETSGHKLDLDK
ncbi:MAG: hypothetical protein KA258_06580, partial [Deltaproteobacteria bacterium]|nr:hypothetical protein [Deltaproteobacteria bacterium]